MAARGFRWLVLLGTLGTSMGIAVAHVASNDWFGRGDLLPMAVWSLPLAAAVALLTGRATRALAGASTACYYVALIPLGAAVGVAWTLVVAVLLGGWIAAFSFPVLACWVGGGFLGGAVAAVSARPGSWPSAIVSSIALVTAMARFDAYTREPEPTIRVVLRAGASPADIKQVWTEVLGHRTGRGEEYTSLPGISTIALNGAVGRNTILTVSFDKGTTPAERGDIIAAIRRSPLVERVAVPAPPPR